MYYDEALNAVKGTPTSVKTLSKDTQALTVSAIRDAHHVAEQWQTGVSTEMVRRKKSGGADLRGFIAVPCWVCHEERLLFVNGIG